ncbi:hypothetical protein ACFQZZ_18510 [Nocardia sp. GCM10030253]|uniref:hypothetical protein n=1 Tax=Nocardia sp. GCM10030253 TaxID=3273404 RepID=UPI0036337C7C
MDLEQYVNSTVTLYGLAEDAMAGAILLCGPSSHVYIDGLQEWSDSDRYSAFEVTGMLVKEGDDADLVSDDGSVAHGIGEHYVMKNPTWERIS